MKSYRTHLVWFSLVALGVVVGCDSGASSGGGSDMDALAAQLDQAKQAEANAKAAAEAAAAKAAADKQAAEEAARREVEQQAAAAQAGRSTAGAATVGEGGGYYSAIVGAHRHITTRMDDLAWISAVKSYWAEKGHYPKSHEEFMECLKIYNTELPPLEQGQEYLYDPNEGQFGTLYIVEPNPAAQPTAPAQ
jgi:hypothetical protein